jgi:hypothetical protein
MIRFAEEGEKPQPKPKLSKLDVARAVLEAVDKKRVVVTPDAPNVVANSASAPVVVANKKRSGDRHKDPEARKAYQRELMRKRRAEKCAHERERRTAAPGDKAS